MKEQYIKELIEALESEGKFIYENKEMSAEEKLVKADILIDTIKFLKGYDRNCKILNQNINKFDPSWDSIEK